MCKGKGEAEPGISMKVDLRSDAGVREGAKLGGMRQRGGLTPHNGHHLRIKVLGRTIHEIIREAKDGGLSSCQSEEQC